MKTLDDLIIHYPALAVCKQDIEDVYKTLYACFKEGNRLYICGNGGSAADALHIVGELVKSFKKPRTLDESFLRCVDDDLSKKLQGAFPAFALVENSALATAFANDVDADFVYAQQVYAYARKGDCVLGISTSGNSVNVLQALKAAHGRGAVALGLTGRMGGMMKETCDICIVVPEQETYKIQELHLPIYHAICSMLEESFWND